MRRRSFIALIGTAIGSGCTALQDQSQSEESTDRPEWVRESGSTAFHVIVNESYSGEVVVQTDCREEERIQVGAGNSLSVDHDQSRTCSLVIRLNGTIELDELVGSSQQYRIIVGPNGSIESTVAVS